MTPLLKVYYSNEHFCKASLVVNDTRDAHEKMQRSTSDI